jgi:diadenosine tetraphosphatase ApaH/serine/threonine PP2A family protein phosphatase
LLTALFSDIHGNLEALQTCLRHASDRAADRYVFLGDFVGYGADPGRIIDIIAGYAGTGSIVLKGNHDEAMEKTTDYFNAVAQASLDWSRAALDDEQKRFLAALPLIERDADCCYVHASAASPHRWTYIDSPAEAKRCVDASERPYTFCGHMHEQMLYFENATGHMSEFRPTPGTPIPVRSTRRWLAIVGSVGQPRDGNPAACYTLFDKARQQITFCRVVYDTSAAAEKIRARGLPAFLAQRLELGI